MESRWNTIDDDPCRVAEGASQGATLEVGLCFERYLGRALWVVFFVVLFLAGRF